MPEGIQINVGIRNAAFHQGLDSMRAGAKKFKGELSGLFAGAIGFGAITAAISKTINYADTIADLAQRFGVGTRELQQFGQVAEQNGSSLEAMASGFNKLEISRSKALSGDAALTKSFQKLGITIEDLKGAKPEDLMLKIGSSSMEAAEMVAILGKSSLELRPALKGLADGTEEFAAAMNEDAIQALAKLSDLGKQVANTLTVYLGGALVWVSNLVKTSVVGWKSAFDALITTATASGRIMENVLRGNVRQVKAELSTLKQDLKNIAQTANDAGYEIWNPPAVAKSPMARTEDDSDAKTKEENEHQKRVDRLARIKEAEEDAARAALEGCEKINALMEERNRLLEIYKKKGDDSDEGLDALEKANKLGRDIASEEKRQEEEQARIRIKAQKDAQEAERKRNDEESEAQQAKADHYLELQDQEKQRKRDAVASIAVSSLQEVGGGARSSGVSSDPAQREMTRQTSLQTRMVALLEQITGQAQPRIPQPWR